MRHLISFGLVLLAGCLCAQAQWPSEPTPGAPRTRDGKVIMTGPAPRINGKPDLSGIWQVEAEPRAAGGLFGLGESPNSKYFRDVLSDFPRGEEPLTRGRPGNFAAKHPARRRWPQLKMSAGRRAPRRSFTGAVQDHPDAAGNSRPVRSGDDLPPDLHRRPQTAARSGSRVAGILDRKMGRRHARDRHDGL